MTHQPPLEPPEGPQQHPDVTQHTAPLSDGRTRAQRQDPAYLLYPHRLRLSRTRLRCCSPA